MKKLIWVTTVAQSMVLFKGQLNFMSNHFDLTFVSSNELKPNELGERGMSEGIQVHELPMKREISLFKDLKSLLAFLSYFHMMKPDAVHGNTPKGALLAMLAAKLTGIRTRIYMCHGLRYQGCSGIMRRILESMEKLTCACATQVLCVSDGVKKTLAKDGICPARKSRVIGYGSCNGINKDFFDASAYSQEEKEGLRNQYGISKDDFLFIFMGRIVKDKGVNEMIEAFTRYRKENPRVRLLILGAFENEQNPVDARVQDVIRGNQDGVVYGGRQSDVRPFLAASQCLLLPSYREGFGMVLMEAGAMGVPVISSDIIGCNNVVTEDNGLLVEPRNADDLYRKMKRMVEDTALYQHFAASTRPSIVNRFDQQRLWNEFLAYYQRII
ncbi:glycosyltransferase, group 1 family protein [Parabacteroides johnsonii DSM 18315]|uniref:Glycosyltransferase, group 1 family protein n=1 Tax=Parabacteroides johnsonii DSM 18315 TaxID=537006 RepID=B7BDW2_9BACT|nr:glycosyltransferase family 4 protein [Parabacteroides johnsonii]EEC95395.1 glycosyltransferase, group 1 family protein [Parabacteroides johnsonii DSM 18315]UEA89356.1 glycosyltransferase family 4 protein [Parabacteroides johnsonii]UWP41519.1 glycosyltransferase family 4 protein [Parabacteroides johnsonii DSM 18315]